MICCPRSKKKKKFLNVNPEKGRRELKKGWPAMNFHGELEFRGFGNLKF